ncbi:BTAD domain-containing putative transcriptional regulator [Streptomyces sp. NPDC048629]|uniref:BTAD domain-containing putative transcriptional regulator n=1 Tax=Streptomyces sp. NPDC048629 TaxID=3154824 RepID=UPI0034350C62
MRYLILGVTEARDSQGAPLPLGGPRVRAVLAALAYRAGRTVSVVELIDDVYGDEPPYDAPAALQALVGRLRRAIGKEAVEATPGPGYRLVAAREDVDLYGFERALTDASAALDAGDAVAAATGLRTALALWRGAADGLVPELTELTDAHPYDETFRAQLVRALRAEGRTADALAAYEDARRTLADRLGADPGPELQALHQELLNPDPAPSFAPAPGPAAPADGPAYEPGNIRARLTSFVGREPELHAIRADLSRSRLVTLTGPGGSGKTRLAEQAAGPTAWLAELAPLDDPDAVPGAVLSALRLREINLITREGQPLQDNPTAALVEHLARRPLLLVLDNCEHVVDAAAALAETLLTHCPDLRILATSREPLGVPGEAVRPVEPLPPAPAHRLFAERARAVRPDFDPDEDPAATDEICRRLDGLPLAIELAAARLRLLSPRQIANRLDDRFRLLSSGSRTVLPRQQTLRAVVDWSWDLLDDAERTLLRQVSVFAGGWDLAAAEALTPDAAGPLGALVDKSLVVAAPADGDGMRYRLLETVHEYATERAAETPAVLAAAEAAHTTHFTALAETAEPRLRSGDQLPWIDRIETDLDNIRAALHRTVLTDRDEPAALRLVFAMGWFWWLRNYRPEGVAWVDRAVALGDDPADRDDPRYWPRMQLRMMQFFLAVESHLISDYREDPELVALVARVRAAFSEPGPQAARFPGLLWPFTAYLTDNPSGVRGLLDIAVDNCRRYGGEWETGVTLMFRTHMAIDMPGGMDGIDDDLVELRALSRRVGDRWMSAQVASAAAEAHMMRARYEDAGAAYEEALGFAREVGAHAEAPFLLARLAELRYRAGDTEAAVKGLAEAAAEAERYHVNESRSYVLFMRCALAMDRGDVAEARAHLDVAMELMAVGAAPPHFGAAVMGLDARVRAFEGEGAAAVAQAAEALRLAHEAQCVDVIMVHLTEVLATALLLAGAAGPAARAMGAAATRRGTFPLSAPERRDLEFLAGRGRDALGEERYAAEHAAGAELDVEALLALAAGFAPEGRGLGGDEPAVRSS